MLKNYLYFLFFILTLSFFVFMIVGGGLLLENSMIFSLGLLTVLVCIVISLITFSLTEKPVFLQDLDLHAGKLFVHLTLFLGFLPMLPALYFYFVLGWDERHGPWWDSIWGVIVLIDWLLLILIFPLLSLSYSIYKSTIDRRKIGQYLLLGCWLAVCQFIWGMIDFFPVTILVD